MHLDGGNKEKSKLFPEKSTKRKKISHTSKRSEYNSVRFSLLYGVKVKEKKRKKTRTWGARGMAKGGDRNLTLANILRFFGAISSASHGSLPKRDNDSWQRQRGRQGMTLEQLSRYHHQTRLFFPCRFRGVCQG
jgi:hypothetical protein